MSNVILNKEVLELALMFAGINLISNNGDLYINEFNLTKGCENAKREIYDELKTDYLTEDVWSRLSERVIENSSEEIVGDIALKAENSLNKCDDYFEAYWNVIDNAIDETIR